jgi:hypothetical protein
MISSVVEKQGDCVIMGEKTKKATFNIHPDILAELDQAMSEGAAPSKNALVERALAKELKELRRKTRKSRWEEGAKDPALLKDITDTEQAFHSADAETAGRPD